MSMSFQTTRVVAQGLDHMVPHSLDARVAWCLRCAQAVAYRDAEDERWVMNPAGVQRCPGRAAAAE